MVVGSPYKGVLYINVIENTTKLMTLFFGVGKNAKPMNNAVFYKMIHLFRGCWIGTFIF